MTFRQTLALALALRLLAIVFLKPGGSLLSSIGDVEFYQRLGELTLGGRLPFRDFWVEYPPLFPFVLTGIYALAIRVPGWPSTTAPFQILVGLFLLASDAANVLLVRRIARRLHPAPRADQAALLYALQPAVLLIGLAWFDAFPLAFLLLGLDAALAGRGALAGAALAMGGLAKVIPLAISPAVLRALAGPRRLGMAALAGLAVTAAVTLPLVATGSPFVGASLRAIVSRSSWESVWALLEGYWGIGTVAPIATRLEVEAAGRPLHPDALPWAAITGLYLLLMLALSLAPLGRERARNTVALATLSLLVTFLFSRGYSPQFLLYPLPLLAALWPGRRGLAYTLGLSALGLLEWPIVLSLFPDRRELIATAIGLRTLAWLWLIAELAAEVWPGPGETWRRSRRPLGAVGLAAASAAVVWMGVAMAGLLPARGEQAPVLDYIRAVSAGQPVGTVFASSRTAFYRLVPTLGPDRTALALGATDADAASDAARPSAGDDWLVLDHSEGDPEARARVEREVAKRGSRATDRWFGFYRLLGFVRPDAWRASGRLRRVDASFGDQLALTGWWSSRETLRPGEPLRIVLGWRVLAPPRVDLTAFAHLLDDRTGAIVAQEDRPIEYLGRLGRSWTAGEEPVTALDVLVPPEAAPTQIRVRLGLYDPATGARLPVAGSDYVDLPGPVLAPRA